MKRRHQIGNVWLQFLLLCLCCSMCFLTRFVSKHGKFRFSGHKHAPESAWWEKFLHLWRRNKTKLGQGRRECARRAEGAAIFQPPSDLGVAVMTDGEPLQLKVISEALPFQTATATGGRINKAQIVVFIHSSFAVALWTEVERQTGPKNKKIQVKANVVGFFSFFFSLFHKRHRYSSRINVQFQ